MQFAHKVLVFLIWTIPVGFVENALFGWAQMQLGITNEVVDHIVRTSIMWGVPALSVAVGFYLYQRVTDLVRKVVPAEHVHETTLVPLEQAEALPERRVYL